MGALQCLGLAPPYDPTDHLKKKKKKISQVHYDCLILSFDGLEQWHALVKWGSQAEKGWNKAVHVDTSQHRKDSTLTRIDA